MITLKKMDVYGQLAIIMSSITYAFLKMDITIIYCYFLVGGWQVLSTVIQLPLKTSLMPQVNDRKAYKFFLMITILTLSLGSYWLLIFIAPFTAIWYLSISFRELKIWKFRRLIQLR